MALTTIKDAAVARRTVIATAKERGVRWVRLAFVDVLGVQKSVSIPAAGLEDAFAGKVTFDGGSIDGFVRGEEVDMVLLPDPATFTILPWVEKDQIEARLLCDIAMPDLTPFEGCSRTTLKRVLEDAGVVSRVIDGRTHRLALRPEALAEASAWIELQRHRWERLFDAVGDYLEERKAQT